MAKQVEPLRQVDPMGEGIRDAWLFLSDTSVAMMIRLGWGFRALDWDAW